MKRIVPVLFLLWALAPTGAAAQTIAGSAEDLDEQAFSPNAKLVKKYPFRNTTLTFWQNMSMLTFDKGAEQTWNPTYSWLLRFTPRYYLTDKLSLRLKVDLGVEWTNSDETTYYHQPLWEDIWFDAVYAKAYVDKATGIDVTPGLRFVLPASKSSQARTLYVGVSPGLTFHRSFKLPHKMGLELTYAFRYTKNLNHYTTAQYDAPTIGSCGVTGSGDCGRFTHSGSRNVSHGFQNILMVDWEITKRLRASQMVAFFNNLLYGLSDTGAFPLDPKYDVNMRAAIWYLTELDYDVHRWLTLGIGVSTYNPQLTEGSTYRAPFFNRYTELMLAATFNLDQIVASVENRMRSHSFTQVAHAQ
ncbi:MAG TPA: hypothetical protein VGQ83_42630 [Polyangia bacterium]